jgi:hypothetical protein
MVHQAGIPRDGVQRCTRCECILIDARNQVQLEDDPINGPRYFPVLASIEMVNAWTDGPRFTGVTDEKPDCEKTH